MSHELSGDQHRIKSKDATEGDCTRIEFRAVPQDSTFFAQFGSGDGNRRRSFSV